MFLTAERWAAVKAKWDEFRATRRGWQSRWLVNNCLRAIRNHAKQAEIEPTHPLTVHTFRKSFGQNHADAGTPIHQLQRMMGHSKIETTRQFYIQHTDANYREAASRYEALMDAAQAKATSDPGNVIAV